jgi:hypothetical protein
VGRSGGAAAAALAHLLLRDLRRRRLLQRGDLLLGALGAWLSLPMNRLQQRQQLGATLRSARLAAGLLLRQVAHVAGCSLTHLAAVERGTCNVSRDVLDQACLCVGMTSRDRDAVLALADFLAADLELKLLNRAELREEVRRR